MGCTGWSYDDCLPHFKSIESYPPGDDEHRGKSGPLKIEDYRTILPLTHRFVEAAQQAGYPLTKTSPARSRKASATPRCRATAASAAPPPALSSPKPEIAPEPERRDQRHRHTPHLRRQALHRRRFNQKGEDRIFTAAREVIVSGGTINSPHLLQISGIGPAEHLKSIGVDVVHDLPGVGRNLRDHYATRVSYRVKDLASINEYARPPRLFGEIAKWLTTGNGALTFGISQRAGLRPQPRGPRKPRHPAPLLARQL